MLYEKKKKRINFCLIQNCNFQNGIIMLICVLYIYCAMCVCVCVRPRTQNRFVFTIRKMSPKQKLIMAFSVIENVAARCRIKCFCNQYHPVKLTAFMELPMMAIYFCPRIGCTPLRFFSHHPIAVYKFSVQISSI